jgi:glycosyltransferase involved in cell wall biosynthesis
VIVPTYDSSALISRAVTSILAQTSPVDEVIVVDDGSTDDTAAVVRGFGRSVRYAYQANAGASAARNLGMRLATCQWIAFLDADDEWFPWKIQRQKAVLQANPNLKWCSCNPELFAHGAGVPGTSPEVAERLLSPRGTVHFFAASPALNFGTGSYLIHRSVLEEAGQFDTGLTRGEDRDMWWRIALRYPEIGFCPETCWRIHLDTPGSLTKQGNSRTRQLAMLCDNMRRAQSYGDDAVKAFHPFARRLAIDYLYRQAGGRAKISPQTVQDAKTLFRPRRLEQLLLAALPKLPRPVVAKILNRITL